jgi:hypothetical protein
LWTGLRIDRVCSSSQPRISFVVNLVSDNAFHWCGIICVSVFINLEHSCITLFCVATLK